MSDHTEQSLKVDFNGLILGFSSAALHYLGHGGVIEGRQEDKINLGLAKQNIDILLLLKEKTTGNLSSQEEKLIEEVLCDLQIKYVAKAEKVK